MKPKRTNVFRGIACLLALCLVATTALAEERTWLWKVEGEGQPASYLFGTIHIDDTRVMDFSQELRDAFHAAQTFAMEAVPQNDMRHALMPSGSLADKLTEAEIDKVRELADEHSLDTDTALRMKPWLLASIFSLPQARSPFTLDVVLYGKAFNDRKRIIGLETPEAHFDILDEVPESDQLILLRSTLNKTPEQKGEEYAKIVDAYLNKDFPTLMAEDQVALEGLTPEAGKRLMYLLLQKRNVGMTEAIRQEMKKGSVFVAVGASHLPGEQGIISLLRKAGYRVTGIHETPLRETAVQSE
jgi:uncharacterized protein YbaP (TraB family)